MWSRRHAIASNPPPSEWATVLESALRPEEVEYFLTQKMAVTLYFSHVKTGEITRLTGMSRKQLVVLGKKCTEPAMDGAIRGFRALIPYLHAHGYTRSAPIGKKFAQQRGGMAGALSACLTKYPELETVLCNKIKQVTKGSKTQEFRIAAKDLHRIFISTLKRLGVTESEWPFTTQHQGIRSIQSFMAEVIARNFASSVANREGQVAVAHLSVGTGHQAFLTFDEPYDAIEIDSYKIESFFSVTVKTPDGLEVELPLDRLWLIAAIERKASAVLAYTVVYRSEVTADDILEVIRKAATERWQPMALTINGLKYAAGSGLPSGVVEKAFGAAWTTLLLDGALAHLAHKIHDKARKLGGFAINWGSVAHFERRPNVERLFKQIGRDLFLRLPSTTGSNPQNGRAVNAQEKAVQHKINADLVAEALDVTIAHHNATPSEGSSYLSPVEVLRQYLESDEKRFMVRTLPEATNAAQRFSVVREEVIVRGKQSTGRRPYVQIDRARYTNPVLSGAGKLIGRKLIVEIDENDMRQVTAYLDTGETLGVLKAHGKWNLRKHTRKTRREINRLQAKRIITISEFDDPIQALVEHLSSQAKPKKGSAKNSPVRPGPTSSNITRLVRVAREAGEAPRLAQPEERRPPTVHAGLREIPDLMPTMPSDKVGKIKNRR